jgi:hypothetical protein
VTSVALGHAAPGSHLVQAMRVFWPSPELVSRRARVSVWLQQGWRDADNGDDAVRLQLVSLACEILVLVRLIEQELPASAPESDTQEIRILCCEHRIAAELVLSASPRTQEHSLKELCTAIDVTHARMVSVRLLRDRVTALRPPKPLRRWHGRKAAPRALNPTSG